ncbi:MAG: DEAD/DEAH box helicase [Palaeococcus sp.]|uniref:DEAD/DEAH box helicase n=1 Tax=Palaeococcus sp. (in: euryarchaeotes) TaxID=2820298 RepID=UPI0025F88C70|nr:DEAD/DEAH box helicase [Palaeococcus sp. (in: euryarchaeotes)]MCD6559279.1 DEAD/DEAH box helicase [Palaeococcus sp. (in: euryarchaeotes)]
MHELLMKAISERFQLNELQLRAFNEVSRGRNVLIIAPTGSGKTESAFLPVINEILERNLEPISALYIAPIKALNRDLLERLRWWGDRVGLSVEVRHGDTSQYAKARQVRNPPHVLIITPETLGILMTMKSMRKHLGNVKFVIIDEIVELVDNKRGVQLSLALERLSKIASFQRIGLSATVGNEEEVREWLKGHVTVKPSLKKEYRIKVLFPQPDERDRDLAKQLKISLEVATRLRILWEILERYERALVFTNTRQFAEILAHRLKAWGKAVEVHHGSLSKEARIQAEKALKEGKIKALICTSSMELGIDIGDVDVVVQYMSPRQVNRLIQRVGRSKHRLGEVSEGYIIATNVEDYLESLIIAKRAVKGKLEKIHIYENALDVLAHFIVGLLMEYRHLGKREIYETARMAYPYRNLTWEEFEGVLNVLRNSYLVGYDEEKDVLYLKRGSFKYYYENLSTIPDEVSYRVLNISSNHIIGRLDESFVMDLEEGMEFIMHGRSWIVLGIDEDARLLKVRESKSLESAIPSWEGEMIPVPFEVALEVGRLKRELIFNFEMAKRFLRDVEFMENELKIAERILRKQDPLGTDRDVGIESLSKALVIHADFGNRANEALGRFIWAFLSSRYGKVFTMKAQAHVIVFKTPFQLNPKEVSEYFFQDGRALEYIISRGIRDSNVYRWRMLNVAKRIGALRREAKIRRVDRLFSGTVIEKETLNEVFHDKVDVEEASKVLEDIQRGMIRIKGRIAGEASPLARINMSVGGEFLVSGGLERDEILELFKRRILDTDVVLICTNCGWKSQTKTSRLKNRLKEWKCPKCGSLMLAVAHPIDSEIFIKYLKKMKRGEKIDKEEEKAYRKLLKASDLIQTYGWDAILALASYGVGPDTAARILGQYKGEALLVALLEAERTFIKNRKFWSD